MSFNPSDRDSDVDSDGDYEHEESYGEESDSEPMDVDHEEEQTPDGDDGEEASATNVNDNKEEDLLDLLVKGDEELAQQAGDNGEDAEEEVDDDPSPMTLLENVDDKALRELVEEKPHLVGETVDPKNLKARLDRSPSVLTVKSSLAKKREAPPAEQQRPEKKTKTQSVAQETATKGSEKDGKVARPTKPSSSSVKILEVAKNETNIKEARGAMTKIVNRAISRMLKENGNDPAKLPFVSDTTRERDWKLPDMVCLCACRDSSVSLPPVISGLDEALEGKLAPALMPTVVPIPGATPKIAESMGGDIGRKHSKLFKPTKTLMVPGRGEEYVSNKPASHYTGYMTPKAVHYIEGPKDPKHPERKRFMPVVAFQLQGNKGCIYAGGDKDNMVVSDRNVMMSSWFLASSILEHAISHVEARVRGSKTDVRPWPRELSVDPAKFLEVFGLTGYVKYGKDSDKEVRWFPWTQEKATIEVKSEPATTATPKPKTAATPKPKAQTKTKPVAKKAVTGPKPKAKPKPPKTGAEPQSVPKPKSKPKPKPQQTDVEPQSVPKPVEDAEEKPEVTCVPHEGQEDVPPESDSEGEDPEEVKMERPAKKHRKNPKPAASRKGPVVTLSDGTVVDLRTKKVTHKFNSKSLFLLVEAMNMPSSETHGWKKNESWQAVPRAEKKRWSERAKELNDKLGLETAPKTVSIKKVMPPVVSSVSVQVNGKPKRRAPSDTVSDKDMPADPKFIKCLLGVMEMPQVKLVDEKALQEFQDKLVRIFQNTIDRGIASNDPPEEFEALLKQLQHKMVSYEIIFRLGRYAHTGGREAVVRVVNAAAIHYAHKHFAKKTDVESAPTQTVSLVDGLF